MQRNTFIRSLVIASAYAAVNSAYGQLTVTAPASTRIVVGQDPNSIFTVQNTVNAPKEFDAIVTPALPLNFVQGVTVVSGSGSINAVILANSLGNVVVDTPVLNGAAGSTYSVALSVTPQGGSAVNKSVTYSLVDNRPLVGTATFSLGRHMVNQTIGSISLSGGSLTGSTGTDVVVHSNGFASLDGFTLTSPSDFTFNGAGQTHSLNVRRDSLGSYSATVALPASNTHTANPGNVTTADFGGYVGFNNGLRTDPLISVERIRGANVNLSGVTFNASGTALANRTLFADPQPNVVARLMQGQATTINVNTSTTISTAGSDSTHTRLKLAAFDVTQDGVRARLANDAVFNSSASTASVALTGTIAVDNSSLGRKDNVFQFGGSISSLDNLPGESLNNDRRTTVRYHVLNDNEVIGGNAVILRYGDAPSFVGQTFSNPTLQRKFSTDTHTAIGIDRNFVATNTSGSTIAAVTAEGLAGEVLTQPFAYSWSTFNVARSALTGSSPATKLKPGDTFTLANGINSQSRADGHISLAGSQASAFKVGPLPMFGSNLHLSPGDSIEWGITLRPGIPTVSPDGFGRIYQAALTASWLDSYVGFIPNAVNNGSVAGSEIVSTRTWDIEHIVPATPTDDTQVPVSPGTDFGDAGLLAKSTRATTAALIDSLSINQSVSVRMQFDAPTSAQQSKGVTGDVVHLTGLHGILHVLQVGFDSSIGTTGELGWFDPTADGGNGDWINAVLGNSNIDDLDLEAGTLTIGGVEMGVDDYLAGTRHVGSYSSYLLSNNLSSPSLGKWGIDPVRNVAWAVIDHNSDFASIPEPASIGVLALAGTGLIARRRRRDAR